jgi:Uncharacterised nucleotidyltransferase
MRNREKRPSMQTPNFFPTPQQTLLLRAMLGSGDTARHSALQWLGETKFHELDRASQRFLPLLHFKLSEFGIEHPLRGRIYGEFRRAWYLDKRLRAELAQIHAALTDEGIDCVLLKGLSLGIHAYASPALRPMEDIDLLVRADDYGSVLAGLERMQWVLSGTVWSLHSIKYFGAVHLSKPGGPVTLDLHTSPYVEARAPDHVRGLWERRRRVEFESSSFWVLAPGDELLHTLAHGQRVSGLPSIRWIVDAVMILRKYPDLDWDSLVSEAERLQLSFVAWRGLDYLRSNFVQNLPQKVLDSLCRTSTVVERIEYHLERHKERGGPVAIWMLFRRSRGNLLHRVAYFLEFYRTIWRAKSWRGVLTLAAARVLLKRDLTANLRDR